MANENKPFGLRLKNDVAQGAISGRLEAFLIQGALAADLMVGDVVYDAGTGADTPVGYGDYNVPIRVAAKAASGAVVLGVIVGFEPVPGNLEKEYHANADGIDMIALVSVDPLAVYECQSDTFAAANIGQNANLTIGAGSAVSGRSTTVVAGASAAVTATLDVKVLGFSKRQGNEVGQYAVLDIQLNNSMYANQVVGGA